MKNIICVILLFINACSSVDNVFKKKVASKISGERTYILGLNSQMSKDNNLTNKAVSLTSDLKNHEWLTSNYIQNNISENIKFDNEYGRNNLKFERFSKTNSYSVPNIIISEDMVYIKDDLKLSAYLKNNLNKEVWTKDIHATGLRKSLPGGGMVYQDGNIYLTSGHREVIAINVTNGKEIWRYSLNNISRSAPVIFDNKLFVITIDNRLYALDPENGSTVWRYEGASEELGSFSSASVSVADQIVLVPHSSGQLHALNIADGEEIWSVNLSYSKSSLEGFSFNDIETPPFVKDGVIYVAGNMGFLYAIDLYTGKFIWRQEIKGVKSFWINKDFLYVINESKELVAIDIENGKLKWITKLKNKDSVKEQDEIFYGPIIADSKLFISTSKGDLIFISPYDGKVIETKKLADSFISAPIIVDNQIYIFNNNSALLIIK